ncbi:hypothetical protein Bbelb_349710 [Branchiostoma belcheri]|nr:hypothetical protein Bbelb_349710 [Branchiostoma belcheri]
MSRLLVEDKILAQRQVAEAIISGDSDKGKTSTMSMPEVPSGDADGILSAFSQSCRELAEVLCGPGEDIAKKTAEIITSFTSTMSDRGATNPLFNGYLEEMRRELLSVAKNEWDTLEGSNVPNFQIVRTQLERRRAALAPPIPYDVANVVIPNQSSETWDGRQYVSHQGNEWGIVVFATNRNYRKMRHCRVLYMDATFRSCPRPYQQFLHGLCHGRVIPLVMALMAHKRIGTYRQVLKHVKSMRTDRPSAPHRSHPPGDGRRSVHTATRLFTLAASGPGPAGVLGDKHRRCKRYWTDPEVLQSKEVHMNIYCSLTEDMAKRIGIDHNKVTNNMNLSKEVSNRYAVFLARTLKFSSIVGYLNIIRILHQEAGYENPPQDNWLPHNSLCGIRHPEAGDADVTGFDNLDLLDWDPTELEDILQSLEVPVAQSSVTAMATATVHDAATGTSTTMAAISTATITDHYISSPHMSPPRYLLTPIPIALNVIPPQTIHYTFSLHSFHCPETLCA